MDNKFLIENKILNAKYLRNQDELNYKERQIEQLKQELKRLSIENKKLKEENDMLKTEKISHAKLLYELSGEQRKRGGNNKRIKNVSKHSTASKRNATRRHSSKR